MCDRETLCIKYIDALNMPTQIFTCKVYLFLLQTSRAFHGSDEIPIHAGRHAQSVSTQVSYSEELGLEVIRHRSGSYRPPLPKDHQLLPRGGPR